MRLAVVGGGQLGRMLGLAGVPLGIDFAFLDPSPDACAASVGELRIGPLDDADAIAELARGADAVTYEWEGVPATALEPLIGHHFVAPDLRALSVSQDRVAEKLLATRLGFATAPWQPVDSRDDLDAALAKIGTPAILKTRSGGYDGKGQARLDGPDDADAAWSRLGDAGPLVLEGVVAFEREVSVIAVRDRNGTTATWPVTANRHERGILRESRVLDEADLQSRAAEVASAALDELAYVGVLCVELFDASGVLYVNEFAPRVHNSGHWTIDGATTCQFENHVRAVLGLPLGITDPLGCAAMLNCIGRMPDAAAVLAIPGAHLHDYGKSPRPGRKVGHVTLVAPDEETLEERLVVARAAICDDG